MSKLDGKIILSEDETRKALLEGAQASYDFVSITYGPKGKNVLLEKPFGRPVLSRDGVAAAREVYFSDRAKNMGAKLLLEASETTNRVAGDGPQPLYAKVLTPTGFVPMGDIVEGMEVCGTNGSLQTVLGVYEKGDREIFRLSLVDGRTVECCEDHLWTVTTKEGVKKTLSVKQLLDSGLRVIRTNGRSQRKFFIQRNKVEFKENSRPSLDPYTLGVLLGDGSLSGSGAVELSLGFKKRHILNKISLPGRTEARATDCAKYIRVKLTGKDMVDSLREHGLYGTISATKFIPEPYLYSGIGTREALLQGLLDTDGYVNAKGLFEFSTVSPQLAADFADLARSLGYDLNISLHTRQNDPDSYSRKPIFRIAQLKGRKHGMGIESIEATGTKTPMRCIKVSNPDNLYVTDGYVVTHNTSGTVVLGYHLLKNGLQAIAAGVHPMDIKQTYMDDSYKLLDRLRELSVPVVDGQLEQVATISSGSPALGKMIAAAVERVGSEGGILTEKAPIDDIECEFVDGYYLQTGFQAIQTGKKELNDPLVVVAIRKISSAHEAVELLQGIAKLSGVKPGEIPRFALIGNIEDAAYNHICYLIAQGAIDAIMLKAPPQFGEMGKHLLEDIATYACCMPITESDNIRNLSTAYIGSLDKLVASKQDSTLFADDSTQMVADRIAKIKEQAATETVDAILEKLHDRISKLDGKVALFRIGAATDTAREEIEFRVEDGIRATRAAAQHGVVAGGGTTLLALSSLGIGSHYSEALLSTFKKLLENANLPAEVTLKEVLEAPAGYGVDLQSGSGIIDMVEAGILDPTLVVEQIIKNATETIANALSVGGATIFEEKWED